jgi:hypothetical protein
VRKRRRRIEAVSNRRRRVFDHSEKEEAKSASKEKFHRFIFGEKEIRSNSPV